MRVPGRDELVLEFTGWRINAEFRVSLLNVCWFHNVSLAKAAKRAEVDFETLKRFMKGEDGLLDYCEMERLVKAVNPRVGFITVTADKENLKHSGPGADVLSDDMRAEYQRSIDWSWEQYSKRGMEKP